MTQKHIKTANSSDVQQPRTSQQISAQKRTSAPSPSAPTAAKVKKPAMSGKRFYVVGGCTF